MKTSTVFARACTAPMIAAMLLLTPVAPAWSAQGASGAEKPAKPPKAPKPAKPPKAAKAQKTAKAPSSKVKFLPSSEESGAERRARLREECKGRPNAGACEGFGR